MGDITKIEWTSTHFKKPVLWRGEYVESIPGATFNIAIGCQKVSPACKFCYAEALDKRWAKGSHWGPGSERKMMSESYWKKPAKWNKEAEQAGVRRKVFCSSLADWAEDHPQLVEPRIRLFKIIEETPHLDWLLLTKRPENILKFIPESWKLNPRQNVWFGTTVESREYLWRIEELCKVPARVRFLSCEPLLEYIDVSKWLFKGYQLFSDRSGARGRIHWVIAGGESGTQARPAHPYWFLRLQMQCAQAGTPFFFKQWGEWQDGSHVQDHKYVGRHGVILENGDFFEWDFKSDTPFQAQVEGAAKYSTDEWNRNEPRVISFVGKKQSGRLLNEKLYDEMPAYDENVFPGSANVSD